MKVEVFAHPLSFRDRPRAQAEHLAGSGVDGVRLAFAYHGGRWLLTTSDPCAVADFRAGRWFHDDSAPEPAGTIRPQLPVRGDDATAATAALRGAGLSVTAWLVGLHQSGPAGRHPGSALRNVFGHRYRHALCPARPEVRDYAADLVARTARRPGVSGLELEAFGYLGWQHQSAHDKLGTPLRPVDRWLLSLCFCPACAARFTAAGVDVPALTQAVRAALRAQLDAPRPAGDPATDARAVLGDDLHATVLAVRARVTEELVRTAAEAAGGLPVSVRTTADPHACDGKSAAGFDALADAAGGLTVTDLSGDAGALRRDLAAAARTGARISAGWSLAADRTTDEAQLAGVAADARSAGADALVLYAYDLAPAARLAWLRGLGAARPAAPTTTYESAPGTTTAAAAGLAIAGPPSAAAPGTAGEAALGPATAAVTARPSPAARTTAPLSVPPTPEPVR
ncbi:hypothetical protein [Streptomyces sp. NPDC060194]|uniref:hypothetical protein n=1 Tax=Streptomyces sp. NPDC060194 TaxID=3347069 RepID=UPI003656B51F